MIVFVDGDGLNYDFAPHLDLIGISLTKSLKKERYGSIFLATSCAPCAVVMLLSLGLLQLHRPAVLLGQSVVQ